jgi:hypothetical protein
MNLPSKDLAQYLEAYGESSGTGLNYAVDLFTDREPAKPTNCVTIFDTPGYGDDLGLTTQGYERPSIQIRIRNVSLSAGYVIAANIKNLLHGASFTINGTLYTVIYCTSGPALLDYDDNGNSRLIINFNLQRHAA